MTTETKHTPGPWVVRSNLGGLAEVTTPGGARVAEIWTTSNSEANREANARLIAQSPAMYAALRFVMRCELGETYEGSTPEMAANVRAVRAIFAAVEGK